MFNSGFSILLEGGTDLTYIKDCFEHHKSQKIFFECTLYESAEIQVESDKANYNADIGFVSKQDGVVPPGTGEGKKQVWTSYKEGD